MNALGTNYVYCKMANRKPGKVAYKSASLQCNSVKLSFFKDKTFDLRNGYVCGMNVSRKS
jgi:hypothetical protein